MPLVGRAPARPTPVRCCAEAHTLVRGPQDGCTPNDVRGWFVTMSTATLN